MISTLMQGYILGLAYAAPIGAQNLFVIESAFRQERWQAIRTALVVAAMDITLGIACILGVGRLIQSVNLLNAVIGVIGCAYMLVQGVLLLLRTDTGAPRAGGRVDGSLVRTAFVLTWLNPHALIDGSIILGGFQTTFPISHTALFVAGMSLASLSWFTTLTAVIHCVRNDLSAPVRRGINIACGLALITLGIKMGYGVLQYVPF